MISLCTLECSVGFGLLFNTGVIPLYCNTNRKVEFLRTKETL